jgi:hypothetical protein
MRSVLFKIISVCLGLTVAFGIAEVAVRIFSPREVAPIRFVFDPQLGEIPTPNQQGRKIRPGVFDYTFSHNSLGLRGSKEYSFEKHTDHRILFLGDSFTYGFGVNDDQTFPYLAEKQLLAKKLSVEVINAGNSGRGTDYELKFFRVLGYKFHPDLTVLCFLSNDFVDNERGQVYRVSPEGEITPKPLSDGRGFIKNVLYNLPGYNWLVSWSQAANLVKEAGIKWYLTRTDPKALREGALIIQYPDLQQGYATNENKRLTEIYLKNLIKSVQKDGSSLLICYLPISAEVEAYRKNGTISHDEAAITEIVKRQGQEINSLTPVFAASGEPLSKLYFIPHDGHWTARGQALAAQYLSEQIAGRFQKN